jgi:hypothetical protein
LEKSILFQPLIRINDKGESPQGRMKAGGIVSLRQCLLVTLGRQGRKNDILRDSIPHRATKFCQRFLFICQYMRSKIGGADADCDQRNPQIPLPRSRKSKKTYTTSLTSRLLLFR